MNRMLLFAYDILALSALTLSSPYYLYRLFRTNKYRGSLAERFGRIPWERLSPIEGRPVCWIHAVSVGEVHTALPLIQQLKNRLPEIAIVLSTVTETGQARARNASSADAVLYLPLDIGFILKPVIRHIQPKVFVIVETEIWPRLLSVLSEQGTEVLMINGRISDRSYPRYLKIRWFWQQVFSRVKYFAMQTKEDARRIRDIGAREDQVIVTGNMKFDRTPKPPRPEEIESLRNQFQLTPDSRLWVAGSTHPGEEEIVLRIYGNLLRRHPHLRLMIAPRHPERTETVERLILNASLPCQRRSQSQSPEKNPVILLDTMGELSTMYALADYVLIGKSLTGWGGQNPLEPAAFGKPIVFGLHMENFREAEKVLLEHQGAVQVKDAEELESVLDGWLQDPPSCRRLGERALAALHSRQGATQQNLDLIAQCLE